MAKLAIQLLTFHRLDTLPALFASLKTQTDKDWTLHWLENASTPDERAKMQQMIDELQPDFLIKQTDNPANVGFSGGHEQLYKTHDADYVMLLNDDAILEPEYVARLRAHLDAHERVAAVAGTILRWDVDPAGQVMKSNVIDSLGLARTRAHKVIDIGAGQPLATVALPKTIFGVSGCLPMYRRAAVGSQLFDPTYFLYKEDVDLAYRLNREGWQAALVPEAHAYHRRSFRSTTSRKELSYRVQYLSYRNHWRNLRKHLTWHDWLTDGWAIMPFETAKAAYMLVTHPTILFNTVRDWL